MSASRRYKVPPYAIRTHEVTLCSEAGARMGGARRGQAELGTLYIFKLVLVELDIE